MTNKHPSIIWLLAIGLLLAQGCGEQESDFQPLASGGFGVVTKWVGVDSGPGAKLFYKGNQKKPSLIWPYLTDGALLYTNDLVFFEGAAPNATGALVHDLYFAAQVPGPACDISEDILKFWAESQHMDFQKIRSHYSPLREKGVEDKIQIHFISDENYPDATVIMTWEQVSNIVQDVKQTGKPHELKNPHVVYLKKDYD